MSVQDLREAQKQVSIVDARRRREYAAGHIPGAIRMGWEQWCEPAPAHAGPILAQPGYWGMLAAQDEAWYAERLVPADRARAVMAAERVLAEEQ